jgi:hypothetical protein
VLIATRAVALVVALVGFYFFLAQQNIFASFAAVLLAGCALMIAFPAVAHWLSGEGAASERERKLRVDAVTVFTALCAFFALGPQSQPHKCDSSVHTLFGNCVAKTD